MNSEALQEIIHQVHVKCAVLMEGKQYDYATEDALSNFYRMNELCFTLDIQPARSPVDCALFLALLKLDRWCNLRRKGGRPQNESIVDTIVDLHNYIDLAFACDLDEEKACSEEEKECSGDYQPVPFTVGALDTMFHFVVE